MIKRSTREKLKKAAINNDLGKYKIYDRLNYCEDEIKSLVKKYKNVPKYTDIFDSNITYKSEYAWRNSIIRKMDISSCNLFFYLLENNIPHCKYCNTKLSIESFSYGGKGFSFKGFKKYCPSCINNQNYKRYKHSQESILKFKISKLKWTNSKSGKLFYEKLGKKNSSSLKKHFQTDRGRNQIKKTSLKQSKILKEKILNGKFTPNITNSWTHWDSIIKLGNKIYKFRSSWEASFFVSNTHCKYESIRIPYIDKNGKSKTYIGDFYDEKNNTLYEIKPRSVFKKEILKINQIIEHCIKNEITFIWLNESNILNYIDKKDFLGENIIQYNKMLEGIYGKNKNKIN